MTKRTESHKMLCDDDELERELQREIEEEARERTRNQSTSDSPAFPTGLDKMTPQSVISALNHTTDASTPSKSTQLNEAVLRTTLLPESENSKLSISNRGNIWQENNNQSLPYYSDTLISKADLNIEQVYSQQNYASPGLPANIIDNESFHNQTQEIIDGSKSDLINPVLDKVRLYLSKLKCDISFLNAIISALFL
ncbi:unnamed protein product [Protopolystoma xenopodis]|uniref:Uncharacterized protein n=1 Tax=Protopolystoma xenopodis TaxID=117903 RepID=A0A448WN17_9PLAT|nr:unnamed protein product [Protopolystoma xenopodis]